MKARHFEGKVALRSSQVETSSRDSFWNMVLETSDIESIREYRPAQCELRFIDRVSEKLQQELVEHFRRPLNNATRAVTQDGDIGRHLLHDFEFFYRRSKRDEYPLSISDFGNIVIQSMELNSRIVSEIPGYADMVRRLASASRVQIGVQIIGYRSLEFGMTIGNVPALLVAFDNDFEAIQVFFDVFVPKVISAEFSTAGNLEFALSATREFEAQIADRSKNVEKPDPTVVQKLSTEQTDIASSALNRAEWLWRLANGSLLVPVLLLLAVLYFTIGEVSKMRTMQVEAMEPILKHYETILRDQEEKGDSGNK